MARRDLSAPWQATVGDDPVEINADEIGDEQEQSAESGAQALRGQIETPGIGHRSGIGAQGGLPFSGRAPRQLADAVAAQDAVHTRRAGGYALLGEPFADLPHREAGRPAECQDAPFPSLPERLFGSRFRPRSGDGEQGRDLAVTAQPGAQIAEGPETVAEAFGGRRGIELLEAVGPEGFVLNLGPGGRMAEEFGEIVHGNPCCWVT